MTGREELHSDPDRIKKIVRFKGQHRLMENWTWALHMKNSDDADDNNIIKDSNARAYC